MHRRERGEQCSSKENLPCSAMAYTTAAHEYVNQHSGQRGCEREQGGRRTLRVGRDVEGHDAQVNDTDVPRMVHLSHEGTAHVRIRRMQEAWCDVP